MKKGSLSASLFHLVEVVRTNWNHLIYDVSEWSEVIENAFPATENRLGH